MQTGTHRKEAQHQYPRIPGRRLMLIGDHRSFYRGQLPEAAGRCFGGFVVYVALDVPFLLKKGQGAWETCEMAAVEPNRTHSLRGGDGFIGQVLLEHEDVCPASLPRWMTSGDGAIYDPALIAHWRRVCELVSSTDRAILNGHLDEALFGSALERRALDCRIAQVIRNLQAHSGERHSAEDCASQIGLSLSRFLHLFKQEVGVPFRRFRAWKRARGLLDIIAQGGNLTDMALDSGYSDSSHFSNSIRGIYGIKPKELVAAARHMPTVRQGMPPSTGRSAAL